MKMPNPASQAVDGYIAGFPKDVRDRLAGLRGAIRSAAPDAEERMSYRMPGYVLEGPLVWFAAFKGHISFFPTSSGVAAFQRELAPYKTSKGTIRFPLGKPLPLALVRRIVRFRAAENKRAKRAGRGRER